MASLAKIEFLSFPNARIIGREVTHSILPNAPNPIPALWEAMHADGTMDMLKSLPLAVADCTIGWMGEFDGQSFTYIAGVIAVANADVPDGFQYRDITACNIAKSYLFGNLQNGDVYANAHELTVGGIKAQGRNENVLPGWSAEIYPNELDFDQEDGEICYLCPYIE